MMNKACWDSQYQIVTLICWVDQLPIVARNQSHKIVS